MEMCPLCNGGEIDAPNCSGCGGSGMVEDREGAVRPEPLPSPFSLDSVKRRRIKEERDAREAEKRHRVRVLLKPESQPEPPPSPKEQAKLAKREMHANNFRDRQLKRFAAAERRERMTPEQRAAEKSNDHGHYKGEKRKFRGKARHCKSEKEATSVVPSAGYREEDGSRHMGHSLRDHGQFGSIPMHDDYD